MEQQVGILRVLRAQQARGALAPEAVVAIKTLVLSKGDDPSLKSIWSFFEEVLRLRAPGMRFSWWLIRLFVDACACSCCVCPACAATDEG
jgi:hypothetical protein